MGAAAVTLPLSAVAGAGLVVLAAAGALPAEFGWDYVWLALAIGGLTVLGPLRRRAGGGGADAGERDRAGRAAVPARVGLAVLALGSASVAASTVVLLTSSPPRP